MPFRIAPKIPAQMVTPRTLIIGENTNMPNKLNIEKLKRINNDTEDKTFIKIALTQSSPPAERLGESAISSTDLNLDFSFKAQTQGMEPIANPNILDTEMNSRIKNKRSTLENKFDNIDDPIYDLDQTPPTLNKAQNSKNNVNASNVLKIMTTINKKTKYSK